MEPSQQQIQDLRSKFLQKLEGEGDQGGFHPLDLARVKNSDDWLRRYISHTEHNIEESLQMLWDCCIWRKTFGTNDISENNVKMEYLTDGSLFYHNRDKDGKLLLIFKCKKHVKGQRNMDELKRVIVYWFERLERLDKGNQISVFFDMAETGMSNMDMEFIKYLIGLFKQYYPDFLNYILVFEMPWILNAAFKIIKSWLPAKAVQKIKFVNKTTLKDYVELAQALTCWGGLDQYTFEFVSEEHNASPFEKGEDIKKKVHFADGSPMTETSPSGFGEGTKSDGGSTVQSSLLSISPLEVINFTSDGTEMTGMLTLTNNGNQSMSYKIKTTTPEKFRVRPSTGILAPGAVGSINVVLQPGYQSPGLSRDKFLVMILPVESPNLSAQELADIWKQSDPKNVEQHRLRCSISASTIDGPIRNGSVLRSGASSELDRQILQLSSQVARLSESNTALLCEVKRTQTLQWLSLVIVFVGVVLLYMLSGARQVHSDQTCPRL